MERSRILRKILVVLAATVCLTGSAVSAQSAPALAVEPTSDPLVWRVTGSGFTPGESVRVLAPGCLPLPCGAGGHAVSAVTIDQQGRFATTLDFAPGLPGISGEVFVTAFPGDRAARADDPLVPIPFDFTTYTPVAGSPTPGTPNVGNSPAAGGHSSNLAIAALFGALGVLGLGLAVRTRRTRH